VNIDKVNPPLINRLVKPLHNENRMKNKVEKFVLELKKIKAKFKGELEFVELDELLSLFIYEFRYAKLEIQKTLIYKFKDVMRWKEDKTELIA